MTLSITTSKHSDLIHAMYAKKKESLELGRICFLLFCYSLNTCFTIKRSLLKGDFENSLGFLSSLKSQTRSSLVQLTLPSIKMWGPGLKVPSGKIKQDDFFFFLKKKL